MRIALPRGREEQGIRVDAGHVDSLAVQSLRDRAEATAEVEDLLPRD